MMWMQYLDKTKTSSLSLEYHSLSCDNTAISLVTSTGFYYQTL